MEKRFNKNVPTAYVDGSFSRKLNKFSYGVYFETKDSNHELSLSQAFGSDNPFFDYDNVAGEIFASIVAIKKAIELGYKEINLVYDFDGIGFFWHYAYKPSNELAAAYKQLIRPLLREITVNFTKVKSHTGIHGNEMADNLARKAILK